jgi:hypothetical protein
VSVCILARILNIVVPVSSALASSAVVLFCCYYPMVRKPVLIANSDAQQLFVDLHLKLPLLRNRGNRFTRSEKRYPGQDCTRQPGHDKGELNIHGTLADAFLCILRVASLQRLSNMHFCEFCVYCA